ncbi:hypothetical protein [Aureispira anguillae]|uniref:Uncharacterized protein n=1 Tax=Aureispira anguillae TaxID=2864201 RepID=A0A916DXP1_9BACT|nr:hypothetical protein [Aureispira anguillae]BDS15266.1 hypothetical protein AsAng_0060500 [Aureispira anguillae]
MIEEILAAAELASSIADSVTSITAEPQDLKDKYRSMTITVCNQTQFPLVYMSSSMQHGRFWTSPTNVGKFNDMTFSACNEDNSILTGLQGGVVFQLQMPKAGGGYETLDIGVGFDDPAIGSFSCSALFTTAAKKASEKTKEGTTKHQSPNLKGKTKDGHDLEIAFLAVSSAGKEAKITITQQIVATS